MARTEDEMVAYALEIDPGLLPFAPELLRDLDALGSDPELAAEMLARLDLPAQALVIDLGCGKGAVSLEIARQLGTRVQGIDLFEPFVLDCQRQAVELGLADRCTFQCGDINKLAGRLEPADVVVYAALGDVLGPLDDTVGVLRRFLKPGGHILINDDFLQPGGKPSFEGFEGCLPHADTIALLEAHGDTVVAEEVESLEETVAENVEINAQIRARANTLAERHPEYAAAFARFVREQEKECAYMETNLVSAMWLIEKA